jgi:hypothetical protein
VRVWRCIHPKITDYLRTVADACRRNIDEGMLNRVKVCFYDEDHRKLDEVCVRLASFPKVDEKNAVAIHNWFRESLLVLESRMCNLPLASSFQVELVCTEQMLNTDWLLVKGRDGGSQDPAVVNLLFPLQFDSSRKDVPNSSSHVHETRRIGFSLHVGAVQIAMQTHILLFKRCPSMYGISEEENGVSRT